MQTARVGQRDRRDRPEQHGSRGRRPGHPPPCRCLWVQPGWRLQILPPLRKSPGSMAMMRMSQSLPQPLWLSSFRKGSNLTPYLPRSAQTRWIRRGCLRSSLWRQQQELQHICHTAGLWRAQEQHSMVAQEKQCPLEMQRSLTLVRGIGRLTSLSPQRMRLPCHTAGPWPAQVLQRLFPQSGAQIPGARESPRPCR